MTSTIKVNNIQNQCGANIINENSNTITLGASGDTIALASGASQSGFGRTGTVDWQTGSIKTAATFSAVNGEGYFVDTSSNAVTANLPAGSAGAIVAFSDYARNFATNNLTISPNGSEKIGGVVADTILSVNGQALTLVYVDATKGWINVQNAEDTETGLPPFPVATGGTITTDGDFKVHTFTGPGTFCVSNIGTTTPANNVDYMVVAGGAAGGPIAASSVTGGGGGAGGYRESPGSLTSYTASPLGASPAVALPISVQGYPITVGAGGAITPWPGRETCKPARSGSVSTFSTITSAGGGASGTYNGNPGLAGGSGGGGGHGPSPGNGGAGNTPPTNPAQGNGGGDGSTTDGNGGSGGGGGAAASGTNGSGTNGGNGGNGTPSGITGAAVTRAGGGGAGSTTGTKGSGGTGGGGNGADVSPNVAAEAGTANTGGGGGGGADGSCGSVSNPGATGGSGVVVIRYKFQ